MQLCGDGCHAICDFCVGYLDKSLFYRNLSFVGEGTCSVNNVGVIASDSCKDFKCRNITLEKIEINIHK